MEIKEIDFEDAYELANNYKNCKSKQDTVMGLFFLRKECGACKHMMEEVLPNATIPPEMKLFKIYTNNHDMPFPPIRTPMAYFFVGGSPVMPILREGVGPVDAVTFDFEQMVKILNGADYYKTFFPDTPKESLPENEK